MGANYICNAKFEGLSYQWQAMYGTAVKANYWHNRTDENNPENATIVSELPDYDNYDDNDGSGSLQNTTTLYPSTYSTTDIASNDSIVFTNSTQNLDDENENDEWTSAEKRLNRNPTTTELFLFS